jgi:hypothetical protein
MESQRAPQIHSRKRTERAEVSREEALSGKPGWFRDAAGNKMVIDRFQNKEIPLQEAEYCSACREMEERDTMNTCTTCEDFFACEVYGSIHDCGEDLVPVSTVKPSLKKRIITLLKERFNEELQLEESGRDKIAGIVRKSATRESIIDILRRVSIGAQIKADIKKMQSKERMRIQLGNYYSIYNKWLDMRKDILVDRRVRTMQEMMESTLYHYLHPPIAVAASDKSSPSTVGSNDNNKSDVLRRNAQVVAEYCDMLLLSFHVFPRESEEVLEKYLKAAKSSASSLQDLVMGKDEGALAELRMLVDSRGKKLKGVLATHTTFRKLELLRRRQKESGDYLRILQMLLND